MDSFNLDKLRSYIPENLPQLPKLPLRMPTWPAGHSSMNPDNEVNEDDDEYGPVMTTGSKEGKRPVKSRSTITDEGRSFEAPQPISTGPRSNLDLINECDNFPYYQTNPKLFFAHINTYYALYIADYPGTELGYILPSVAAVLRGLPDWRVDDHDRSLTLVTGSTETERSKIVAMTTSALRATDHFKILRGWRDELYPVYGPNRDLLFSIERAASALFGIVTYGVHMTAYTRSKRPKSEAEVGGDEEEMQIWVPRRAATKQTYGGMLDNTVAGGVATGESVLEAMVRESVEEASLPEDLVRKHAEAVGAVTYFHIRDQRAGGETRLLQPECQYVYDLELPESVVPKPSDDEVEGFELMGVEEVKEALRQGEFKPNCALVLLDFFVRHGILTAKDEGYIEMVARLHRRLEFPTV
ncbi:hypothetical protein LTR91_018607 [Friedmanniomyces endolithicus]|uniref:Nudix hydrolase domain-containing protein n=1 Tax=Friedmanniomyces endolithicus TaxID=329885 RepID=A0AAN6HFV1_9PEZI|nr:hypothetical protein LTR91_018607 [Friedmanniomyces endolithicus]